MTDATAPARSQPALLFPPARREHRPDDPHRPAYHFLPPANWMNDPNGLIYWNNQYHLFYQYNPTGPFWGTIHWGHAVSDDLVHWQDLPVALAPTPGGVDSDGCWSGCAVDNEGIPTLIYTGVKGEMQLPCMATSPDGLRTWQKYEGNPILANLPPGLDLVAFRDPMVWREDDLWYLLAGSGIKGAGGAALLFYSANLTEWAYLHPLSAGDLRQSDRLWTGTMWECPQLLKLGDKHVLVFAVWDQKPRFSAAQIGTYANRRFKLERECKLDYGEDYFYAPQTLIDKAGRSIMWGWVREGYHTNGANLPVADWAGVMSLPRVFSILADGQLGIAPAPELRDLRGVHHHFKATYLSPNSYQKVEGVEGECLEIVVEVELEAGYIFGVGIRCSPDGEEESLITFDRETQWLSIDPGRSSIGSIEPPEKLGGPLVCKPGELLRLHIFVDHSIIEVFANGQACITARIYPLRTDSLGVKVFVEGKGGAAIKSLDIWELGSIWSN